MNLERSYDLTAAVLTLAVATEKANGTSYPEARDNVLYTYERMQREVSD